MEIITNLRSGYDDGIFIPVQLQDNSIISTEAGKYQISLTVVYEGSNNGLLLCSIVVSKNSLSTDTFQTTLRYCPNDGCKALYDVDQLTSPKAFRKAQRKIRLNDEFDPEEAGKLLEEAAAKQRTIRLCSMCSRPYRFSDTTDTITWRVPLNDLAAIVSEMAESLSFNTSIVFIRGKSGRDIRKLRNELVPSKAVNFNSNEYKKGLKSARACDTYVLLNCAKFNELLRHQKCFDIIRGLFQ